MGLDNLSGQTLGAYELRELLGAGGMGAVYRAVQINLKREVAVKVLFSRLMEHSGYLERFNREAKVAAALEHPHIVPVYDYGAQDNISYVVMRLLAGGSLADRLKRAAISEQLPSIGEVSDLLKQIASALDYAHSRGVIHRDIKPSNIMFDNHGNAYVVDFGIAKLLDATSGLTGTGQTLGTPSYMPPEQWRDDELTAAADQYALGVLIYNMITGRLPFEAATPFALMHKHLNEVPLPPQAFRSELPHAVTLVLERAMAKLPRDRFSTVTAFSQAFDAATEGMKGEVTGFFYATPQPRIMDDGPTVTPAAFPAQRTPTPITGTGQRPRQTTPTPGVYTPTPGAFTPTPGVGTSQPVPLQPARRSPLIWILGVVIALLVVAIAVLVLVRPGPNTPTPTPTIAAQVADNPTEVGETAQPASQSTPVAPTEESGQGAIIVLSTEQATPADATQAAETEAVVVVQAASDTPEEAATESPSETPIPTDTETEVPTETSVPTSTEAPSETLEPTATIAPSATLEPSATPELPSETPVPTNTEVLPSETPVPTNTEVLPSTTPVPTTEVPTLTPVPTNTESPAVSPTPSATFGFSTAPSPTPTSAEAPVTATSTIRCVVGVEAPEGVQLHSRAAAQSAPGMTLPNGTQANVTRITSDDSGGVWYFVQAQVNGSTAQGWVSADEVVKVTACTQAAAEPTPVPVSGANSANLEFSEIINGTGWSYPETDGDTTFIWTTDANATLPITLAPGASYNIKFRVLGAIAPEVLDSLSLSVGGTPVPLTYREDSSGARIYDGVLPDALVGSGAVTLTFGVSETHSPQELSQSSDTRTLGVKLDWLRIEPRAGGAAIVTATPASSGAALQYGGSVTAALVNPTDGDRWTFDGQVNDEIMISLASAAFDTVMDLYDPSGTLIATSDDEGGVTNSFLHLTLNASGTYTISARSYDTTVTGDYTLYLTQMPPDSLNALSPLVTLQLLAQDGVLTQADTQNQVAETLDAQILDLSGWDRTYRWMRLQNTYTDFVMGVTFYWGPGAQDDTCGITFHELNRDNYYALEIDRSGTLWLTKFLRGEWQTPQSVSVPAINLDEGGSNAIVLTVRDGHFDVLINNQTHQTFDDNSIVGGNIGLSAGTLADSAETRCTYTDVWIVPLE